MAGTSMNEVAAALEILEKERGISRNILLDAIENSLIQACKSNYGHADNIKVEMNRETCEYKVYAEKEVAEVVEDGLTQISLEEARTYNAQNHYGDKVLVPIPSKGFNRIATQNAKNVILQKIREEERKSLYEEYSAQLGLVVTGIVQRPGPGNISVNIGKCDAVLPENEQVASENLLPTQRVKVYVLEVKETSKGPRIQVSRTHPGLVKRLFELQVAEVKDGIVEIKNIAREPGSRTKMAVYSVDSNVDAVGSCVGMNGERVNAVVKDLCGEKIDIIEWDPNPAILIENALNPAQVICVIADEDEKSAQVIVPDDQLSLAIGKNGQNVRLAAKLTGFNIDIKNETEAIKLGLFDNLDLVSEEHDEFVGYAELADNDEADSMTFDNIADMLEDQE